jgi:hypothetical protein
MFRRFTQLRRRQLAALTNHHACTGAVDMTGHYIAAVNLKEVPGSQSASLVIRARDSSAMIINSCTRFR